MGAQSRQTRLERKAISSGSPMFSVCRSAHAEFRRIVPNGRAHRSFYVGDTLLDRSLHL